MPRTDISRLSDEARMWVFGITPALPVAQQQLVFERIDPFLEGWAAHGHPIVSGRDIIDGVFLIIAVEKSEVTSGCSIDRLFGTLQKLERELGVSILDPSRVFFRQSTGRVAAMSRPEFREGGDLHTVVFDTTADVLGVVRDGTWERAARDSWHKVLLRATAEAR